MSPTSWGQACVGTCDPAQGWGGVVRAVCREPADPYSTVGIWSYEQACEAGETNQLGLWWPRRVQPSQSYTHWHDDQSS